MSTASPSSSSSLSLPILAEELLLRAEPNSWSGTLARGSKRLIDIVGATVGLIVLMPILLLVALVVRLDSPGPILFRQRRLGQGGRPFNLLKFRTMVVDAERRLADLEAANEIPGGVLFKIRRDPRVTRVGGFLRTSSLDELPQLVNVLLGQMSLVGPRPLQIRDCQRLEETDPIGFATRLTVPQGLTGLWQTSGRCDLSTDQMVALDREYAERWSLWLDLKILGKTVRVVLTGRGAC